MTFILKKLIPCKIKNIYRLHGKYFFYKKRIDNLMNMKNYSLLVGTPLHENIGDHLICIAERLFLHENNNNEIVEIPIEAYKLFKKRIISFVDSSVLIFIQGGGWMGTVWPNDELLIQDIIKSFSNNKVIVFPQTAYYEDSRSPLVLSGLDCYKGSNLYIFLRENNSFREMHMLYPSLKIYCEPDIALFLKNKINLTPKERKGIGVCFRSDRECLNNLLKKEILDYLSESRKKIEYIDTINNTHISEFDRKKIIDKILSDFSRYELIITDRLHGMIISYIVNTPCIVIDNKTHKVSAVFNTWLSKSKIIALVNSFEDFMNVFDTISKNREYYINFDFSSLKKVIKNGKN